MATYSVTLPIAGYAIVEVEADSEEAAIDAALMSDDLNNDAIEEWSAYPVIVQGNVMYASPNRASAEKIED